MIQVSTFLVIFATELINVFNGSIAEKVLQNTKYPQIRVQSYCIYSENTHYSLIY